MKVVAINGSPHAEGNTYHCLKVVGEALQKQDISTEILHIGTKAISGCLGCGSCYANKNAKCVLNEDSLNELIPKIREADGLLLGSPVHFAGISGAMKSFLDRLFYVSGANGNFFYHKVGAAVVVVRRSGGVAAVDSLKHYLEYAEMLMPTSNYWNVVHGAIPGEAAKDAEGEQILSILGENMGWLMRLKEAGKDIQPPAIRKKVKMSFIRD